jgi:hypothetical protein
MNMINDHKQAVDDNQSSDTEQLSTWEKLTRDFKGMQFLKKAVRLKQIRQDAVQAKAEIEVERAELKKQLRQIVDPLDKLACEQEIVLLGDRIIRIDQGLSTIETRVNTLVSGISKT